MNRSHVVHFFGTPVVPSVSENVGKWELPYSADGNTKYSYFGKQFKFLIKLKIYLLKEPAIPFSRYLPKINKNVRRETCIQMFSTALFITSSHGNNPNKCLLTGD